MSNKVLIAWFTLLGLALIGAVYHTFFLPNKPIPNVGGPIIESTAIVGEESTFAHVNADGVVDQVIVINWDTLSAKGGWYVNNEFRPLDEWKRTSVSGAIRKNYAGKGATYDKTLDAFIPPKEPDETVWNTARARWELPVIAQKISATST